GEIISRLPFPKARNNSAFAVKHRNPETTSRMFIPSRRDHRPAAARRPKYHMTADCARLTDWLVPHQAAILILAFSLRQAKLPG
ncbi:MAG: hypothetical protein OXP11_18505, partial [Gammaproteobacteria bacterium]|nr:hypothetical protein [Gammaproteobacteria bacterium]